MSPIANPLIPEQEVTVMSHSAVLPAPVRSGGPVAPQSFGRLLRVEIRKMVDTRGGVAVLAATGGAILVALGWLVIRGGEASWNHLSGVTAIAGLLLPVIGLLGVTSEWSQRTALTTFTLSPRRGRVLVAKVAGSVLLAAVVFALTIGLVAAATVLDGAIHGSAVDFSGFAASLRALAILTFLQVIMAVGFGAVAGQTAVAVVGYFVAPSLVGALSVGLLGANGQWINVFSAYDRLSSAQPWSNLGATVVSMLIWVGIPFTVGVARWLRREVK